MFNYNLLFTPIIKDICLAPAFKHFLLDIKDVLAYKQFIRSVQ